MKRFKWLDSIEVLGWDLDGTLYRSPPEIRKQLHLSQTQAVADKKGWDFARAEREYRLRYKKYGSNTKTLQAFGIDGIEFFSDFWDKTELEDFIDKNERLSKMLENLGDKRQFIISNSNREDQVKLKLKLIGIRDSLFDFIVSTVALGQVKPDPGPFLFALEQLDVEPGKVLFIGDRVSTDIMGAKSVGMRTCLVWEESKKADISLESVYEVGRLFGKTA